MQAKARASGSRVGISRGAGEGAGKCILNLLKVFNLRESPFERQLQ